jgi:uncharacterized damage-inducible protein DinB
MTNEEVFLKYSCDKLSQHTERIGKCLDKLTNEQVWLRHSENENAVGNLVLHLCGNIRQWIGTGIAGKPDVRVRDREFSARGNVEPGDLKQRLEQTVAEAIAAIRDLTPERLREHVTVQSYDVPVLGAIYHVVEHFSGHAGQIVFATKLFTGEDLGFYRHLRAPVHQESVP